MQMFNPFLQTIENETHRTKVAELFTWVAETFPQLETTIKWNQPMFTDHGTFIIGFSVAKQHFSVTPEAQGLSPFVERITEADYSQTQNLFRIKWTQDIDYDLLRDMIQFNIDDKADCTTFWRK